MRGGGGAPQGHGAGRGSAAGKPRTHVSVHGTRHYQCNGRVCERGGVVGARVWGVGPVGVGTHSTTLGMGMLSVVDMPNKQHAMGNNQAP